MKLLVTLLLVALAAATFACGSDDNGGNNSSGGPKMYSAEPPMTIDQNKQYFATIKTEVGDMKVELYPKDAPHHVNSFVFLAREGFYNGVTFHRVIPGFVAQAGDPTGTGSGGPGYNIQDEVNSRTFEDGTLTAPAGSGVLFKSRLERYSLSGMAPGCTSLRAAYNAIPNVPN